jgi:hypothetical protein
MCLKKLWNATIFPDMIRAKKEKKARKKQLEEEEDRMRESVMHEARLEAMGKMKDVMKEKMVEEEVKRMTTPKKNFLQKIGEDLAGSGFKMPDNNRMRDVWGANKTTQPGQNTAQQTSGLPSQEKISGMMGGGKFNSQQPSNFPSQEKLTGMVSTRAPSPKMEKDNKDRFEQERIRGLIHGKDNFNYIKQNVKVSPSRIKKQSSIKAKRVVIIK